MILFLINDYNYTCYFSFILMDLHGLTKVNNTR